jgi:hypothetical protein
MNIGKNGKVSDQVNLYMKIRESYRTLYSHPLNMEPKEEVMVDKAKLLSILTQVERRISFMKQWEIDDDFKMKNKMEFVNYWSSVKVKVTIEVIDYEEEISSGTSTLSLEESGACANAIEH